MGGKFAVPKGKGAARGYGRRLATVWAGVAGAILLCGLAACAQGAGISRGAAGLYALAEPTGEAATAGLSPSGAIGGGTVASETVAGGTMAAFVSPPSAQAEPKFHGPLWHVAEVEGGYAAIRSTASPLKCGCFSADGGNGSMVYHLTNSLGIAGDGARVWAPSGSSEAGLNLTTALFGPQISALMAGHLLAFGHYLLGRAQADGVQERHGTLGSFADAWGGGLDWVVSRDTSVRIAEIDEDVTHFREGIAGRQRNLRVVFGVVFRFKTK